MSFALRTSTRSSELRNVSAITREMIYRLLAEQVYAGLMKTSAACSRSRSRCRSSTCGARTRRDSIARFRSSSDCASGRRSSMRSRRASINATTSFASFCAIEVALGGKRAQQRSTSERRAPSRQVATSSTRSPLTLPRHRRQMWFACSNRHGFDLLGACSRRRRGTRDRIARRENAPRERDGSGATGSAPSNRRQIRASRIASAPRPGTSCRQQPRSVAITSLRLASLMANKGEMSRGFLSAVGNDPEQQVRRTSRSACL